MPLPGERAAPIFWPEQPQTLERYFTTLNTLLARANIADEDDKKHYSRLYVDIDVADLWELLPEAAVTHIYQAYKQAIFKLYPGAEADRRYTRTGLE
jgi:hypothetical protein